MMPRDPDSMFDQPHSFSRFFATAFSATDTRAMFTCPKRFRVESVELIVDTTYATDPTDNYALSLIHGTGPITAATFSTNTQGAITADVPSAMVLSATDANLIIPAGEVVSFLATKNASAANLTVGVVVHGRYV